jgi:hypothetical protein
VIGGFLAALRHAGANPRVDVRSLFFNLPAHLAILGRFFRRQSAIADDALYDLSILVATGIPCD